MHVIAAKAVAFRERCSRVQGLPAAGGGRTQAMANAPLQGAASSTSSPAAPRNHLMLVDMIGKGVTGKDAEGARPRQHHREQERRAERSASAVGDQRPAHGHAGGNHPRLRRTGLATWRTGSADAGRPGKDENGDAGEGERRGAVPEVPGLRQFTGVAWPRPSDTGDAVGARAAANRHRHPPFRNPWWPEPESRTPTPAMHCPFCQSTDNTWSSIRASAKTARRCRRRRECEACMVLLDAGNDARRWWWRSPRATRRENFDARKAAPEHGARALHKRPVSR